MEMTSQEAARVLFNCATLLEMAEANRYRVAAYRNAARVMLQLGELAPRAVANDEALRGLHFGKRMSRKLRELFTTGRLDFYVELVAQQPLPVARLMTVPGVGPKTAHRLYKELGINSPRALMAAARAGEIQKLRGFGPRREQQWAGLGPELPPPAAPAALPQAA